MRAASVLLAVALVATMGCNKVPRVAGRPSCTPGTRANWSADSAIALCLPAQFKPAANIVPGRSRWERSTTDPSDRAWISAALDAALDTLNEWPPRLRNSSTCAADCTSVDSLSHHSDSTSSGVADVETGLVSGGYAGLRRQPTLVAGLSLPSGRRLWINGSARNSATLDTLRHAIQTIRVREN